MSNASENNLMTFGEHLEVLRHVVIKCLILWVACSIISFLFKDYIFTIIFAPSKYDFILYRMQCTIAQKIGIDSLCPDFFEIKFINTKLASQFMTHLSVSMWVGLIFSTPYIIYKLYGFISPALYKNEKKYSHFLIFSSFILFSIGILLNYFIIFPFSFRFLSTYQVSDVVVNQISLSSYVSTFVMLSLMLGIIFEIPILAYFLAKLNLLTADIMKTYRKHAYVIISIIAAIITPTADIVTLLLVSLPITFLYEFSIMVVKKTNQ